MRLSVLRFKPRYRDCARMLRTESRGHTRDRRYDDHITPIICRAVIFGKALLSAIQAYVHHC
ncbi:uncharacterized protein PgNI_08241, partial [Pyricularia grisea]|uniref:Uncharacterized protein n=1 Tax=Pyricularia grisea TaxID=148305 RepID=A0A6P8AVH0_PYRGI